MPVDKFGSNFTISIIKREPCFSIILAASNIRLTLAGKAAGSNEFRLTSYSPPIYYAIPIIDHYGIMTEPIDFPSAHFVLSGIEARDWVKDKGAEVAFVGRSNVGKSSAINTITNQKGLARTSKTPGRTQHLVFFEFTDGIRMVDLPGYGFAKTPLVVRNHWQQRIMQYLSERESLKGLVIPMDIRRPFTDLDQQMMDWTHELQLPVHILLTKADKLSWGKASAVLHDVKRKWLGDYDATVQLFSAPKRIGIDEARQKIQDWLLGTQEGI